MLIQIKGIAIWQLHEIVPDDNLEQMAVDVGKDCI
jgi:hypothetical protein